MLLSASVGGLFSTTQVTVDIALTACEQLSTPQKGISDTSKDDELACGRMEDTSLDQFADSGTDGEDPVVDRDEAVADKNGRSATPSDGTVEPATTTSRWTSDGEPCSACGETVSRLWDDDGELRCRACKEW